MRKFGITVFTIMGIGMIASELMVLSGVFANSDLAASGDVIAMLVTLGIMASVILLLGISLIVFAKPLSVKLFPKGGPELRLDAQQFLQVLLVAIGIYFIFTRILILVNLAAAFFDTEIAGSMKILPGSLIRPLAGILISSLLIYVAPTLSRRLLPPREDL